VPDIEVKERETGGQERKKEGRKEGESEGRE
jgi:hypothetical protein